MSSAGTAGGGRRFTVILALLANVGVGLAKLAAGLLTGSGALLSEAAHSAGDTAALSDCNPPEHPALCTFQRPYELRSRALKGAKPVR